MTKEYPCFDQVRDTLSLRLMNVSKEEKIKRANGVYRIVEDLILYIEAREQILITKQMLSFWEMTEDEIFHAAIHSKEMDKAGIFDLEDMVFWITCGSEVKIPNYRYEPPCNGSPYPFVITELDDCNGSAGVIFCPAIQKRLQELCPEGFTILPSSRKEVIICPNSFGLDYDQLKEMVREINMDQNSVPETDKLSDSIYTIKKGKIVRI